MIADYNVGMPTTSLVPDWMLLNLNMGEKPQPFRNRQVIGSSPIVGSIFSTTCGSGHRDLLHICAQAIFASNRFIALVSTLATVLL